LESNFLRIYYGWVIVTYGIVATCISVGTIISLSLFFQPVAAELASSRAGISSVSTLAFLSMGVGGFIWGTLADRFGTRAVVVAGGILIGLGLVASSHARNLTELQLAFGVIVGLAAGSSFAPLTALTSSWFTRRRSLAVALVSMGLGMGTIIMVPLASALIEAYGWRSALMVLSGLAFFVVTPGAMLLRQPPQELPAAGQAGTPEVDMSASEALRTPQFIAIALTFFFCCAAHSGPILHMVSFASLAGASPLAATGMLTLAGVGGLIGRIAMGLAADRYGARRILVIGLALQATTIALYAGIDELTSLFVLSVFFGIGYGGVMPLYAVLIREYFGARIMGTAFGAVTMISSVGMALGPLAGGWLYDHYATYTGMYLGAGAAGVGAVLIAFAFRAPVAPAGVAVAGR
jgi:MFS family permease